MHDAIAARSLRCPFTTDSKYGAGILRDECPAVDGYNLYRVTAEREADAAAGSNMRRSQHDSDAI